MKNRQAFKILRRDRLPTFNADEGCSAICSCHTELAKGGESMNNFAFAVDLICRVSLPFVCMWGMYLPPSQDVRREHYDVIEANTVYFETAECDKYPLEYKPQFTQMLFRNWEDSTGQMEIHAWRMVKGFPNPDESLPSDLRTLPERQRTHMYVERNAAGLWEMRWLDGDVLRVVTADSYVTTETVGDPVAFQPGTGGGGGPPPPATFGFRGVWSMFLGGVNGKP